MKERGRFSYKAHGKGTLEKNRQGRREDSGEKVKRGGSVDKKEKSDIFVSSMHCSGGRVKGHNIKEGKKPETDIVHAITMRRGRGGPPNI